MGFTIFHDYIGQDRQPSVKKDAFLEPDESC